MESGAFVSDESKRAEVYVQAFPTGGEMAASAASLRSAGGVRILPPGTCRKALQGVKKTLQAGSPPEMKCASTFSNIINGRVIARAIT
jgi:hypothetical protein